MHVPCVQVAEVQAADRLDGGTQRAQDHVLEKLRLHRHIHPLYSCLLRARSNKRDLPAADHGKTPLPT